VLGNAAARQLGSAIKDTFPWWAREEDYPNDEFRISKPENIPENVYFRVIEFNTRRGETHHRKTRQELREAKL
jgi:hypothetical protein